MINHPKITVSLPRKTNAAGDTIEAMTYELAGIVDVRLVLEKYGIDEMMLFSSKGHPTNIMKGKFFKNKAVSSCIMRINPDDKSRHPSFGVFFATKDVNPGFKRPLISSEDLVLYREKFKAVHFQSHWNSWEAAIAEYASSSAL